MLLPALLLVSLAAAPGDEPRSVVIDKSDRTLTVLAGARPLAVFRSIRFGGRPAGHKQFEGDERTPEGRYRIDVRNAHSRYHLSLRISYPDTADRAAAKPLVDRRVATYSSTGSQDGRWPPGCPGTGPTAASLSPMRKWTGYGR